MEALKARSETKRRNPEADLYRLLFAVIIADFHVTKFFQSGHLAVEFFFILSGYFTYEKLQTVSAETLGMSIPRYSVRMTLKKFKPIFFYTVPVTLIYYLGVYPAAGGSLLQCVTSMSYELFLTQISGLYVDFLMLPFWYLSAMLLTLPIFIWVCLKHREFFTWLLAPLSALFIYGYLVQAHGGVQEWGIWTGVIFTSVFRAWAGLCTGVGAYWLSRWLRGFSFKKSGRAALLLAQYGCLTAVLLYFYMTKGGKTDPIVVGLFAVMAGILLSGETHLAKHLPFSGKFLGELSLALYVTHFHLWDVIYWEIPVLSDSRLLVMGAMILVAVVYVYFIRLLRKIPFNKLKKLFIEE